MDRRVDRVGSRRRRDRAGSMISLAGLALISGTSFLFIKIAVQALPPLYVPFGRVAIAAVVLLGVLAARRERLPGDRRFWGHVVVAAAVGLVLPFTLFGYAEQHTS